MVAKAQEIADILSERVTYEEAAEILHISPRQLRREIAWGELVVIQPPSGWTKGRIEVEALRDWLEKQARKAKVAADRKQRQTAQNRGRKPGGRAPGRSAECVGQR